jgi:hypothetical protein
MKKSVSEGKERKKNGKLSGRKEEKLKERKKAELSAVCSSKLIS